MVAASISSDPNFRSHEMTVRGCRINLVILSLTGTTPLEVHYTRHDHNLPQQSARPRHRPTYLLLQRRGLS